MSSRSFREKFPEVKRLTFDSILTGRSRGREYENKLTFDEGNIVSWLHCPSCGNKIYITSYLGWNVFAKKLSYDEGFIECSGYLLLGSQRRKCDTRLHYRVTVEYAPSKTTG